MYNATHDIDAPISVTEPPPIPDWLIAALTKQDAGYAAFEWRVPEPAEVDWDAVAPKHVATGWYRGERV